VVTITRVPASREAAPHDASDRQERIEDSAPEAAARLRRPQVRWTMIPENTIKFARFMRSTGMLESAAATCGNRPPKISPRHRAIAGTRQSCLAPAHGNF
jgi:hypothetical protein